MRKMIWMGLWVVGSLLLLIALVFGGASILALIARVQHGRGLFFADVEFLGLVAVIAVIFGAATLFIAKRLSTSGKH